MAKSNGLKLKCLNDGFVSHKHVARACCNQAMALKLTKFILRCCKSFAIWFYFVIICYDILLIRLGVCLNPEPCIVCIMPQIMWHVEEKGK